MTRIKQSWIQWRQVFLDDPRVSYGAKGMGLFLHSYMNDNQDIAWPSIATICGRMGCSRTTAIKHLHELESLGWIRKEKRFGKSVIYHALVPQEILSSPDIGLVQEVDHSSPESGPTVVQNLDPNISMNNQKNNQRGKNGKRFVPPSLQEVTEYVNTRGSGIDPQSFLDHYEANGWMRGKNKVRDWKACVRTWENKRKNGADSPSTGEIFAI